MLHLITTRQNASDAHLRAMYEARKRVFVDLLKWDVPVLADRYELDQFDDEHAQYLILADTDGGHLASARLLPTTRAHLLDSLFPGLCPLEVPRGGNIFEISRFCLDRRLCARERRQARDMLITALVDHALVAGITGYTGVADMGWFQQILSFGWHCDPLGVPVPYPCGLLVALRIHITADTPELLRRAAIIEPCGAAQERDRHAG
ncbi:acyl-homoserine-lactone synthase [Sphingomonas sp. UYEF23]|uniref:acyl-homoserine-lactone synthase n=1 Tax=Sphingomonas sp. UYEF23 TaxID=1756408 RepID=UPI003391115E